MLRWVTGVGGVPGREAARTLASRLGTHLKRSYIDHERGYSDQLIDFTIAITRRVHQLGHLELERPTWSTKKQDSEEHTSDREDGDQVGQVCQVIFCVSRPRH